ncbi:hypothetical protein [Lacticaseibacillus paracasei]|uniref:hypothetical protein n=2 Tax=Lacticaseibacillus paracasei TaxID=1597 RepID=UPI0008DDED9D|nr:hypothetical protein [Lacticaseibacillus paracasei]OHY43704.1 hypothetical protein BBX46_14815 [Lacticaseibacillus paracasei]WCZ16764.1 hypothetical protein HKJ34_10525 [Lacticaseibacillus paracasei]
MNEKEKEKFLIAKLAQSADSVVQLSEALRYATTVLNHDLKKVCELLELYSDQSRWRLLLIQYNF